MIRSFSLFAFFWIAACADTAAAVDSPDPTSPLPSGPSVSSAPGQPSAQTFENDAFGFGFDYPSTLTPVETNATNARLLVVRLLFPEEASDPLLRDRAPGQFEVEVFANPDGLGVSAWLDANGWPVGTSAATSSPATVSGESALELRTERMLAPNRFIYVAWRSQILSLVPLGPDADRVLKSFRLF